jgi:hypothetical protein
MNLDYAVERLYQSGWVPGLSVGHCESLPDGRPFPGVEAIEREFADAGLELHVKHNLVFNTYRATWAPFGEEIDANASVERDARHGTVIGSSQFEAAVYALAAYRESQGVARQPAMA